MNQSTGQLISKKTNQPPRYWYFQGLEKYAVRTKVVRNTHSPVFLQVEPRPNIFAQTRVQTHFPAVLFSTDCMLDPESCLYVRAEYIREGRRCVWRAFL